MRIWEPRLSAVIFVSKDMASCQLCPLPSSPLPFSLLVLLSCYRAHFLVPYMLYVELTARHCAEIETAQFPVSCWGSERWRQLQVICLVNLCLVSSTWVADNPLCGCCCENRPLMSLCNYICAKCICQAADGGREEKAQTDYAGFRVLLRETNLNICVKQAEKVNVTLLSNLSVS